METNLNETSQICRMNRSRKGRNKVGSLKYTRGISIDGFLGRLFSPSGGQFHPLEFDQVNTEVWY